MIRKRLFSLIFVVTALLFWIFFRPEWLNYHEQYQLFQFSFDYLIEHLSLPGGMAVYASEFLVQFFYNTYLGALVVAGVLCGIGLLTKEIVQKGFEISAPEPLFYLPSALIWAYSGDEKMLFTFPTAILLSLVATYIFLKAKGRKQIYIKLALIPIIYWLIGYCVWIYIITIGIVHIKNSVDKLKAFGMLVAEALYCIGIQFFVAYVITRNYPLIDIFCGIGYYYERMTIPFWQHLITITIIVMPLLAYIITKIKTVAAFYASAAVCIGIIVYTSLVGYDAFKYSFIKIDYLTRAQKWEELLDFAKKVKQPSDFAATGINLALAMTNQLPDRLFEYNQTGNGGFLTKFEYNSFSCGPTAEACYYLGLINSVLRYNFDMQSGILTCKNSGRFYKRIAEAYILNQRYDVAQRYLTKLKQTLFYRAWALQAEERMGDKTRMHENDDWARIDRMRLRNEYNYTFTEMDHMMMTLFENCPDNKMAIDYALCICLVNRDLKSFIAYMPYYTKAYGKANLPRIYQQAYAWVCYQNGYKIENMPDFISEQTRKELKDFNYAYLLNPKSLERGRFANSFWKYIVMN